MYKHHDSPSPPRPSTIRYSGPRGSSDEYDASADPHEQTVSGRDLQSDATGDPYNNPLGSGLLKELRRWDNKAVVPPFIDDPAASGSSSRYGYDAGATSLHAKEEKGDGRARGGGDLSYASDIPRCATTPSRPHWTRSSYRRSASDAGLDAPGRSNSGGNDEEASNSDFQESLRGEDFTDDSGQKRKCLVCDDAASGYHYGVSSCEACKAFFKRTIQGNIEYACPANGACIIDKRRRKACQACRYKKCIDVGMLKEGVRLDRVRGGRQKYRRTVNGESVLSATSGPPSSTGIRKPGLSGESAQLIALLIACEPETVLANLTEALDTGDKLQAVLCDLADRDLIGIIGWAKQIPGFPDLPLNDQMHLLQATWCEILLFSLCWRSMDAQRRTLLWTEDFPLTDAMAVEARFEEVHTKACRLVEALHDLRMTKEEYVLIKCIILLNGSCALESTAARNTLRDSIILGLHQTGNGGTRSCNLLLLLPHLRQLDRLAKQYWVLVKNEGKILMHKLFLEMLESTQQLM